MKDIAISVGDLNGISTELILSTHNIIKTKCNPLYCVDPELFDQATAIIGKFPPADMRLHALGDKYNIQPGKVCKDAGAYSFKSFTTALDLCDSGKVAGVMTLPIHKKSWELAGIGFAGHTRYLEDRYNTKALMMLGCEKLFVALFTDHISFCEIINRIQPDSLHDFLVTLGKSLNTQKPIAVLGLNPHCGDEGVMGLEDAFIDQAVDEANQTLGKKLFVGSMVPDTAFIPQNRERFTHYVAMYHDQGLTPLKALYFEESINVTLGLPIKRSSVDHGCGFDIAYNLDKPKSNLSFINAIEYLAANA